MQSRNYNDIQEFEKKFIKVKNIIKKSVSKNDKKIRILENGRIRYFKNKEKYRERNKLYINKYKDRFRAQQKQYLQTFPEKTKARYLFFKEKKKGNIITLPCEKCGEIKTHGHHDDYNLPLKVRYLCSKHHHEFHREHIYNKKTFTYVKKTI